MDGNYEKLTSHLSKQNGYRLVERLNEIDQVGIMASDYPSIKHIKMFYHRVDSFYSTLFRLIPEATHAKIRITRNNYRKLIYLMSNDSSYKTQNSSDLLLAIVQEYRHLIQNGAQEEHELFYRFEKQAQRGLRDVDFYDKEQLDNFLNKKALE